MNDKWYTHMTADDLEGLMVDVAIKDHGHAKATTHRGRLHKRVGYMSIYLRRESGSLLHKLNVLQPSRDHPDTWMECAYVTNVSRADTTNTDDGPCFTAFARIAEDVRIGDIVTTANGQHGIVIALDPADKISSLCLLCDTPDDLDNGNTPIWILDSRFDCGYRTAQPTPSDPGLYYDKNGDLWMFDPHSHAMRLTKNNMYMVPATIGDVSFGTARQFAPFIPFDKDES